MEKMEIVIVETTASLPDDFVSVSYHVTLFNWALFCVGVLVGFLLAVYTQKSNARVTPESQRDSRPV